MHWIDGADTSSALTAVGHRVVHGGDRFSGPTRITASSRRAIDDLCALAPLHQPFSLACIDAITERRPDLPQVACFDTAFHSTLGPVARLQALPEDLRDETLVRYGFHGLSYESVATTTASLLDEAQQQRVVVAHLGSGASLCALRCGVSVDTTMGFSALDGLVMGTRPGSLDTGLILHLLKTRNLDPESLEDALYHRAGLLGISGISSDMQTLLESRVPEAALAVDYFVYRAAREIGAMAAVLGGVDTLVFTGGIGENSPLIRSRIARACAWLGLRLDDDANERGATWLSHDDSPVAVLRIATDEESVIAQHTAALLAEPARAR